MRRLAPIPASIALLALSAATGLIPSARAQGVKTVNRTVKVDPRGEIVLSTFKGSIDVTTWDRSEVKVDARIEPDGMPELVALTEVRIQGGGRRLTIESDHDRASDWQRRSSWHNVSLPFVRYRIVVPRSAQLIIDDHKSELRLAGLRGPLTIDTHKGRVRVDALEGSIRLSTHKGTADVRFARLSGDSSLDTHKGTITIGVPARAGYDLVADVGRRGRLHGPPAVSSAGQRDDDEVRRAVVGGGGPRLALSTHKGELRIETR